MAAIELIAEEPIRFSTQRIVSCDGGNVKTLVIHKTIMLI